MATTTCNPEIHVGDIGTLFEISLKECSEIVDISSADFYEFIFRKPDESLLTKTPTLKTDGTDGVLRYSSIDGDLDQSGKWKLQVKIGFPNGTSWSSDITSFKVYANLSIT